VFIVISTVVRDVTEDVSTVVVTEDVSTVVVTEDVSNLGKIFSLEYMFISLFKLKFK
jgi:hypothetical protein